MFLCSTSPALTQDSHVAALSSRMASLVRLRRGKTGPRTIIPDAAAGEQSGSSKSKLIASSAFHTAQNLVSDQVRLRCFGAQVVCPGLRDGMAFKTRVPDNLTQDRQRYGLQ